MKYQLHTVLLSIYLGITSCNLEFKKQNNTYIENDTILKPTYAEGFFITKKNNIKTLHVKSNSNEVSHYTLIEKKDSLTFKPTNNFINIPSSKIVASSTTDIPFFETLNASHNLIGFSETNYISSKKTRALIANKKIREVGKASQLNTEVLLELKPDLFISSSSIENKNLSFLKQNKTPILHNTSWQEKHPLGRAEWIKVFGYLFNKQKKADSIFSIIESKYNSLVKIASTSKEQPTVLSGNLYKDVWYTPAGNSFEAQLIKDANGNYLWKNSIGNASLALSIEAILDKGKKADIWLGGGLFDTTEKLCKYEQKYSLFDAVNAKQVYTKDLTQGTTGGIWYFEIGALRPDWILEDLIQIFHPNLLVKKDFHFYKKLN